jgi:hypothetical protein
VGGNLDISEKMGGKLDICRKIIECLDLIPISTLTVASFRGLSGFRGLGVGVASGRRWGAAASEYSR